MVIYYVNKKGSRVECRLTKHAIQKFKERYKKVNGEEPREPELLIKALFEKSKKQNLNTGGNDAYKRLKKRNRRNGGNTMYFLSEQGFTFVVKDSAIMTVEISAKGLRHLN